MGLCRTRGWAPVAYLGDPVCVEPEGRDGLQVARDDDADGHEDTEAKPHEPSVGLKDEMRWDGKGGDEAEHGWHREQC